jgi:hypothetical protein
MRANDNRDGVVVVADDDDEIDEIGDFCSGSLSLPLCAATVATVDEETDNTGGGGLVSTRRRYARASCLKSSSLGRSRALNSSKKTAV